MPDPAALRRASGLTQHQVAELLECSAHHVSRMETGRRACTRPVALVLEALADGWRPRGWSAEKEVEPAP